MQQSSSYLLVSKSLVYQLQPLLISSFPTVEAIIVNNNISASKTVYHRGKDNNDKTFVVNYVLKSM